MAFLTLRYDLRRAPFARASHAELYAACLEQCAWGDERGFTSVALAEHHGVDDGWLPSPLTMAGAVAGRTRNVRVFVAAALVPLYDPLRLAEDVAVLDLASGGRVAIVAGLGYRPEEFEMFGVDRSRRGALVERYVEVLKQAWTGAPFEYEGRTVRVTPTPRSPAQQLVFLGGSTERSARRAARLGVPFWPAVGDPDLAAAYEAACEEEGFRGGFVVLPRGPGLVHVAEDPEKAWAQIGPYALHEAQTYASWQTDGQRSQVTTDASNVEELKTSGVYEIVTPDDCVELARRNGSVTFHPLIAGLDPELGWESLELFESKVLPRLS